MGKIKLRPSDIMFSQYIRTRDKWACCRCGKYYEPPTRALHCSHFQGRGRENTRFDVRNADALCYGCHQYFTSHPGEHMEWQIMRKGQDVVDDIILSSRKYKKRNDKEELAYWKGKLDELQ